MVSSKGQACSRCAFTHWVEYQAGVRFSQIFSRPGWPDVVFAFHDKEEVGPKMLARIAKHIGFKPDDL